MFTTDPDFIPVRRSDGVVDVDADTRLALFTLSEDLRYVHPDGREFVAGKDSPSDCGSISHPVLQFLLSPHEYDFKRAFRLHDGLYNGAVNRLDADLIFLAAMREEGCDMLRSVAAFLAVRVFGGSHYRKVNFKPND